MTKACAAAADRRAATIAINAIETVRNRCEKRIGSVEPQQLNRRILIGNTFRSEKRLSAKQAPSLRLFSETPVSGSPAVASRNRRSELREEPEKASRRVLAK